MYSCLWACHDGGPSHDREGSKSLHMSIFRSVENYVRQSQVWGSIFRHGIPRDRRTRAMAILSNVFLHLHPVAVRKSGIRLSFTWCR